MKTGKIAFDHSGIREFDKGGIRCALLGQMRAEEKVGAEAVFTYLEKDPAMKRLPFGGMYILMAWFEEEKCLRVWQDFFTGPLPLYYTQAGDMLYVDSSLKYLLERSGKRPGINMDAARQFMAHGVVFGQDTLLEEVYKIKPMHALEAREKPFQYAVSYPVPSLTKQQALEKWEEVLQGNILHGAQDRADMPLSSGYDSNYIMYTLQRRKKGTVRAFSLGAHTGVSELNIVKENIKHYPGAQLFTACTSRDTLSHMEEMVWRLEGSVYEAGIFLQYELARMMKEKGVARAICGECADQVMNMHFALPGADQSLPRNPLVSKDPYAYGSHIVVKKSAVMLNSFGIEGSYPYIDLPFYALCSALAPLNAEGKLHHKQVCAKRLPQGVLRHISKVGGSTSLHSLFNEGEITRFFAYVEGLPRFHQLRVLETPVGAPGQGGGFLARVRRFIKAEPSVKLLLSKMLAKMQVSSARDYSAAFRQEEKKLNEYMKIYYLHVFEKLFTLDFDSQAREEKRKSALPW